MPQITAKEASQILGISKRTLFRWEEEGRIKSIREGILKVRLYDKAYIEETKQILDLNERERELVKKVHEAFEEEKNVLFVQDVDKVRSGAEKLHIMDIEEAGKAMDKVDVTEKEWREVLDALFKFPRQRLRELLLNKE